jgi:hypothetical protein
VDPIEETLLGTQIKLQPIADQTAFSVFKDHIADGHPISCLGIDLYPVCLKDVVKVADLDKTLGYHETALSVLDERVGPNLGFLFWQKGLGGNSWGSHPQGRSFVEGGRGLSQHYHRGP